MRIVLVTLVSLLFPGFGAGITRRYRVLAGFVVATAVMFVICALSVWCLPAFLLLPIASGVDAMRAMRGRAAPLDGIGAVIAIAASTAVGMPARAFVIESFKIPASSMVPTLAVNDHIYVDKLSMRFGGVGHGDVIVFQQPCQPSRDYVKRVVALAGETVEVRCNVVYVQGKAVPSQPAGATCAYDDYDEMSGEWRSRPCSEYVETAGGHTYHVLHDADRPARDARTEKVADGKDFPRVDGPRLPPSCASEEYVDHTGVTHQQAGALVETKASAGACEPQLHYVVPDGHVFVLGDNRANSNDSRYWGAVPIDNIRGRVRGIWMTIGPAGVTFRRFGGID